MNKTMLKKISISIPILACVMGIIIVIFVIRGKKMDTEEITAQSIKQQIEELSSKDSLFTSGKITLNETRVDYTVYTTKEKKKAVMEIFNESDLIYGMEYYELEDQAYVYLGNEKKYVTLPYKFENEGRFMDIASATLKDDRSIIIDKEEAVESYRWEIPPDEFLDLLLNEFDAELKKLLEDFNKTVPGQNPIAYEDIKKITMNNVFTEDHIIIKQNNNEDGINLVFELPTLFGHISIRETTKEFTGDIDIREIDPEQTIPLEEYTGYSTNIF